MDEALNLDAELSWNYEARNKSKFYFPNLNFELTGFPDGFFKSNNSCFSIFRRIRYRISKRRRNNRTLGAEAGIRFDIHQLLRTNYIISLSVYSTYVNSTYSSDRFITVGNQTINVKNNKLPYAPEFLLTTSLDFNTLFGFGINLSTTYVGEQFTDELNTIEASPSGETGLMKSFITADLTASYLITDFNSNIYFSVKNLFDERYIASRRPQGIKVGLPRFISAGIELTF